MNLLTGNNEQKVLCHMDIWSSNIIYNKEKGNLIINNANLSSSTGNIRLAL